MLCFKEFEAIVNLCKSMRVGASPMSHHRYFGNGVSLLSVLFSGFVITHHYLFRVGVTALTNHRLIVNLSGRGSGPDHDLFHLLIVPINPSHFS